MITASTKTYSFANSVRNLIVRVAKKSGRSRVVKVTAFIGILRAVLRILRAVLRIFLLIITKCFVHHINNMSSQYNLNKADMAKVGKGLLIAVGGSILTYLAALLPDLNLGNYAPVLFPFFSSLINMGLKWVSTNE